MAIGESAPCLINQKMIRKLLHCALLLLVVTAAQARSLPEGKPLRLPFHFIENRGQVTDRQGRPRQDVLFTAAGGQAQLFVTATGIHYQFSRSLAAGADSAALTQTSRFSMELAGANPHAAIRREHKSPAVYHYYLAAHPEGIRNVESYERIVYEQIYPHIDWVLYCEGPNLKYDFVVHPGGNPDDIRLKFRHARDLAITRDGALQISTELGTVTEKAPLSFADGQRVPSRFRRHADGSVGFEVAAVPGSTLVIDPAVVWATYYGGTGADAGNSVAVESGGNIYMAGTTSSASGIAQAGFQNNPGGSNDAFLAKFDSSGYLLWATYYGGAGNDAGIDCATDAAGNVFLSGQTTSPGLASGGYQNTPGGGADAFLVKFDGAGSRLWATYYGGAGTDGSATTETSGLCTDANNNVYLYVPTTPASTGLAGGGFQDTLPSAIAIGSVLAKFGPAGNRIWATYCNGQAGGCTTDNNNNIFITGLRINTSITGGIATPGSFQPNSGTGNCAFLIKMDSSGNKIWGTFYCGGAQVSNYGRTCMTDAAGNVYMAGETYTADTLHNSGGFQSTYGGGTDAFIVKFSATGSRLWGSYYGGSGSDFPTQGFVDPDGNVLLTGQTTSPNNIAGGGFQNTYGGGNLDGFVVKFNSAGNRLWGSYYGGPGMDRIICGKDAPHHNIYLSGQTNSAAGIALPGTYQPTAGGGLDAFLVKVGDIGLFTGTNISTGPICAGSALSVPYTLFGTYNSGNIFTAQLSDASGSFASPVNIGSLAGTTAGAIAATIPAGTPPGTAYRIRVVSSDPAIIAPNNGSNLTVISCCTNDSVTETAATCSNQLPYLWHGISVPAGGTAVTSDTLQNAGGCDSIVYLTLTVIPVVTHTVYDTTCRDQFPLTWNGITLPAPAGNTATATYTTPAANGCDSIVTLDLFVRDTVTFTDQQSYCRNDLPAVWNGITIPATAVSGTAYAVYTATASNGCDSIVTLDLVIHDTAAVTVFDTLCRNALPYTWNGLTVNAPPSGNSTTATYVTQTTNGCDSTVTLRLFIRDTSAHTVVQNICSNQLPYTWNGISITAGGAAAAVFTTPNAAGCDSVVTLHLIVHDTSATTETVSICENQLPYTWNGIVVAAGGPGAAVYTTTNLAGCDSVVTLNLDVSDTVHATESVTLCASELPYTWNGITVAAGGASAAVYTTQGSAGCDSTVTLNLTVIPSVLPAVGIGASPAGTVPAGTPVTFTAVLSNGGTAPVLQWKKNGLNVGTNSVTYTDLSLDSGDVITCILVSNAPCADPDTVSSNSIVASILMPPPPCLVPLTLISTDIQLSAAIFRWSPVEGAEGYEVALDTSPGDPVSGTFTTDTAYHASALLPGIHYFHIRTQCGTGYYSPWIAIKITIQDAGGSTAIGGPNGGKDIFTLYPNPNNGAFTLSGSVAGSKAAVDIVDQAGRSIYSRETGTLGRELRLPVNLSGRMAPGIYLIRIASGNQVNVIRFVYR